MSEVSQGAGWWIASDGKWYPPELHPDAPQRQAPPAPAPPQQPAALPQRYPQTQYQQMAASQPPPFQQVPAYQQPVPGQPSSFVDPWIAQAQAQHASAAAAPAAAAQAATAVAGASWRAGAPVVGSAGAAGAKRRMPPKPLLLVAAAVVVVAAVGGVLFAVLGGSSSTATARGTAQIALNDLAGNNLPALCSIEIPSAQAQCRSEMAFASAVKFTATNVVLGKVTTEGTEALAVVTGTICYTESGQTSPNCETNNNPNLVLGPGQSFPQAFAAASGSSSSAGASTIPLVEQNGTWYVNSVP